MKIETTPGQYRLIRIFTSKGLCFIFIDHVYIITLGTVESCSIIGVSKSSTNVFPEGSVEVECGSEGIWEFSIGDPDYYYYTGELSFDQTINATLDMFDENYLSQDFPARFTDEEEQEMEKFYESCREQKRKDNGEV